MFIYIFKYEYVIYVILSLLLSLKQKPLSGILHVIYSFKNDIYLDSLRYFQV